MTEAKNTTVRGQKETAREVAEYVLAQTGAALLSGNFSQFEVCFGLPHDIDTIDGRRTLTTISEVRDTFEAVRQHLVVSGVTDMVRHVVEASFQDADTIVSTHETRLVGGGVLLQNPFPVFSILKRVGTGWQIFYSQYAIVDEEEHNQALMGARSTG